MSLSVTCPSKFESISTQVRLETKTTYSKPDYDESTFITYAVSFRNVIGVKVDVELTINFQKLLITISEPDNGKNIATIEGDKIIMAIPSQNVNTQVTILVQNIKNRDSYKIWVPEDDLRRVNYILKDVNKLVELYRDVIEDGSYAAFTQAAQQAPAQQPQGMPGMMPPMQPQMQGGMQPQMQGGMQPQMQMPQQGMPPMQGMQGGMPGMMPQMQGGMQPQGMPGMMPPMQQQPQGMPQNMPPQNMQYGGMPPMQQGMPGMMPQQGMPPMQQQQQGMPGMMPQQGMPQGMPPQNMQYGGMPPQGMPQQGMSYQGY